VVLTKDLRGDWEEVKNRLNALRRVRFERLCRVMAVAEGTLGRLWIFTNEAPMEWRTLKEELRAGGKLKEPRAR
jgi:hypothetical protein